MKKVIVAVMSMSLLFGVGSVMETQTASAKVTCKQVNAKYKQGIKKSASTKNKIYKNKKYVRSDKSNAYVSASLYKKYASLDSDKDGIVCER